MLYLRFRDRCRSVQGVGGVRSAWCMVRLIVYLVSRDIRPLFPGRDWPVRIVGIARVLVQSPIHRPALHSHMMVLSADKVRGRCRVCVCVRAPLPLPCSPNLYQHKRRKNGGREVIPDSQVHLAACAA